MESLFDVCFRKWCSGASQIAFHDCQKSLQNHVFSRIVHLARQPPVNEPMLRVSEGPGNAFANGLMQNPVDPDGAIQKMVLRSKNPDASGPHRRC